MAIFLTRTIHSVQAHRQRIIQLQNIMKWLCHWCKWEANIRSLWNRCLYSNFHKQPARRDKLTNTVSRNRQNSFHIHPSLIMKGRNHQGDPREILPSQCSWWYDTPPEWFSFFQSYSQTFIIFIAYHFRSIVMYFHIIFQGMEQTTISEKYGKFPASIARESQQMQNSRSEVMGV